MHFSSIFSIYLFFSFHLQNKTQNRLRNFISHVVGGLWMETTPSHSAELQRDITARFPPPTEIITYKLTITFNVD